MHTITLTCAKQADFILLQQTYIVYTVHCLLNICVYLKNKLNWQECKKLVNQNRLLTRQVR